jgi:hypothetical protein
MYTYGDGRRSVLLGRSVICEAYLKRYLLYVSRGSSVSTATDY